jgi:phosphate:Na+ symporter
MGANIGTTVTAWIISAIGFKVNIAAFALPLLGIGLPMVFSGKSKRKSIGEFVFGFSFLFMGLSYLNKSAEALELGNIVANMLAGWAGNGGFFTILLFVFVGAVVTMIVQASAATMAVTLMLFDMQIPGFGFELAAALAMGQNIGTTITAFIASMTANTQARRAAFAHMFFNVFGVIFILLIFHPFCDAVTWFVTNVMGAGNNDLFKLSAFHSAFNICNTLLLIGFVKQIEKFVCWLLPQKESDEEYRLQYISAGILSTAELSILEAQKEIHSYAERCNRMAGFVDELMNTEKDEDFNKLYSRIEKYENITDNMEVEIANYLHKVSDGRLSIESKMEIMRMLRQITELESIGDSCYNLARTLNRHRENSKIPFTEQQLSNMHTMMTMVRKAMSFMQVAVEDVLNGRHVDYNRSYNIENEINNYRRQLKNRNLQDVDAGVYNYQIGVFYIDFISECEKLGDYVLNVVQATTPEKI